MEEAVLSVRSADTGWLLECGAEAPPRTFPSGAQAETEAYALAVRLAATGRVVRVDVKGRDGKLAGFRYYGG